MLALVSWKSLLALSMPWKTWKVEALIVVRGGKRASADVGLGAEAMAARHFRMGGPKAGGGGIGTCSAVEFYFYFSKIKK